MATFGSFVAGQVLTAAELNAAGTWQDYTPSWTQSATISKTVNWARFTQFNKLVIGSIKMTATSGGTGGNKILVGLPVNASSNNFIIGSMLLFKNSVTYKYAWTSKLALFDSATTMTFVPLNTGGTLPAGSGGSTSDDKRAGETYTDGSGTGSMAITSGDIFWIQFMYEAA